MLIATLRNIGLAVSGGQSEFEILLAEQAKKYQSQSSIVVCNVNLQSGDFFIETEDFSEDKIRLFIPGVTGGNSKNYSPLVSMSVTGVKNVDKAKASTVVKLDKIKEFEKYAEGISEKIVLEFAYWFRDHTKEIQEKVFEYLKKNFVIENKKGVKVFKKDTPVLLTFAILDNGGYKKLGEFKGFRELYLKVKSEGLKIVNNKNAVVCISCGKAKEKLFPLSDCKFFELFSLDQFYYKMHFQNQTLQAMVCEDCETLIRLGNKELNSTLKFLAYKLKISENKWKIVYHSIIPLVDSPEKIRNFLKFVNQYRKNYYNSTQITKREKLARLAESLEKVDKKRKKEIRKQISELEKAIKKLEEGDYIDYSMDAPYVDLLKELQKSELGVLDFYFTEEQTSGSKKKLVEEILYGNKQRVRQIVIWIKETSEEFGKEYSFELGYLMKTFGEKMGRKILQALFNGNKIRKRDLFRATYVELWPKFKHSILSSAEKYERIILNKNIDTFHFTLDLLERAELLVER